MTLLLFHHGNSFESIYQSSSAIRHVALKIKSRSFHQFTAVYEDREKSQAVWAINFKWLSKHAAATLTASLLTPDLSAYKKSTISFSSSACILILDVLAMLQII